MNPIVLALDTDDLSHADKLVAEVRDHIGMIKIGTELWSAHGPESFKIASNYSLPVFLDLKLHDIPNTVGKTISSIIFNHSNKCDISFISVHAFGGKKMLQEAVVASRGSSTSVAAVSLLTSLDYKDLSWLGFSDTRENIKTASLSAGAYNQGVRTFVCSPMNAALLRKKFDISHDPIRLITPGIRAANVKPDDQKRTCDVAAAIKNGSSYLVIGRPITEDPEPKAAAKMLNEEAQKAIAKWGYK